jgi:hypothetical protein
MSQSLVNPYLPTGTSFFTVAFSNTENMIIIFGAFPAETALLSFANVFTFSG